MIWGAALAAVVLGVVQNASILVIPSEWQGFLLYVFLFATIIFFPQGIRLPARLSGSSRRADAVTRRRPTSARNRSSDDAMDYIYSVIILIGLFVILASSFNLVIGYGGLISIAHPIFYGLGAYTSALLARDARPARAAAMLAGAAAGHRAVGR